MYVSILPLPPLLHRLRHDSYTGHATEGTGWLALSAWTHRAGNVFDSECTARRHSCKAERQLLLSGSTYDIGGGVRT